MWRWPLLLAGVVCAAYLNSLPLGLALDAAVLSKDARIQSLTAENLLLILRGPYWPPDFLFGLYRPLTTLSFLFNYTILGSGQNGSGWHAINLLIHLVNTGLVYALARRVIKTPRTAWFAAALWAVHPVGVDTVTNVAGRADLLAAVGVLGGLFWYIRRESDSSAPPIVTAGVLFAIGFAGICGKESAAALPGLMLLWDMSLGSGTRDWKRRLPFYGATILAIALFLLVRPNLPPMLVPVVDNAEVSAGFLTARLTALNVVAKYLFLLVWPLHLSSDYGYNQVPLAHPGNPLSWISPILIAALLAAVVIRHRRDPVLFFAAGWFGIALLPVSNLVVIIGAIMAERFLYLPALGFAIAAAVLLERMAARFASGWEREVALAAALLLGLFTLRTAARNPDWKDDATLWASNLAGAPMSHKVHKNIGTALNFRDPRGTLDEATRHLEIAYKIVGDLPLADMPESVLVDLGLLYRLKGDRAGGTASPEGREWYSKSLELLLKGREVARLRQARIGGVADFPHLYANLGLVLEKVGRHDEALEAYRYGMRYDVRGSTFYNSIIRVLSDRDDVEGTTLTTLQQWISGAGDKAIVERLRSLYALVPTGQCAFVSSGSGYTMNPNCPKLRQDLCAAGANAIRVFLDGRQPGEARKIKATLLGSYGCPAEPLNAILPE